MKLINNVHFQQDIATVHTSWTSMLLPQDIFEEWIILKRNFTSRVADLIPLGFSYEKLMERDVPELEKKSMSNHILHCT